MWKTAFKNLKGVWVAYFSFFPGDNFSFDYSGLSI